MRVTAVRADARLAVVLDAIPQGTLGKQTSRNVLEVLLQTLLPPSGVSDREDVRSTDPGQWQQIAASVAKMLGGDTLSPGHSHVLHLHLAECAKHLPLVHLAAIVRGIASATHPDTDRAWWAHFAAEFGTRALALRESSHELGVRALAVHTQGGPRKLRVSKIEQCVLRDEDALRAAMSQLGREELPNFVKELLLGVGNPAVDAAASAIRDVGMPRWGTDQRRTELHTFVAGLEDPAIDARALGVILGRRVDGTNSSARTREAVISACADYVLDGSVGLEKRIAPFLTGFLSATASASTTGMSDLGSKQLIDGGFAVFGTAPEQDSERVDVMDLIAKFSVDVALDYLDLGSMDRQAFLRYLDLLNSPSTEVVEARDWMTPADRGVILSHVWMALTEHSPSRADLLPALLSHIGASMKAFPFDDLLTLLGAMHKALGTECEAASGPGAGPRSEVARHPLWQLALDRLTTRCSDYIARISAAGNRRHDPGLTEAIFRAGEKMKQLSASNEKHPEVPSTVKTEMNKLLGAAYGALMQASSARYATPTTNQPHRDDAFVA